MESKLIYWLVGQTRNFEIGLWEFQGIFSTEALAIAACRNQYYFYVPVLLDEELPEESMEWDEKTEIIYPHWTPNSSGRNAGVAIVREQN